MIMITCPNCGELNQNQINIYSEKLRKQTFSFSPILPTCTYCGAEVEIEVAVNNTYADSNIIVLNGTCGSGKSTVAEILAGKGYIVIDGDCVIQSVKYKKNIKNVDFNEMADEITCELDILSMFGNKFVLSSVILPEDLDKYIKIFKSRNLNYMFFLLKPDYKTAVERCQSRTCHTSITPEYWIKYFYDLLEFDDRVIILDNTNMTVEETADYILNFSSI